jgi:hypothetical protein
VCGRTPCPVLALPVPPSPAAPAHRRSTVRLAAVPAGCQRSCLPGSGSVGLAAVNVDHHRCERRLPLPVRQMRCRRPHPPSPRRTAGQSTALKGTQRRSMAASGGVPTVNDRNCTPHHRFHVASGDRECSICSIRVEPRTVQPGPGPPLRIRRRPPDLSGGLVLCSGGRIRTYDLWVMSPASYRAAPPRDGLPCENRSLRSALSATWDSVAHSPGERESPAQPGFPGHTGDTRGTDCPPAPTTCRSRQPPRRPVRRGPYRSPRRNRRSGPSRPCPSRR